MIQGEILEIYTCSSAGQAMRPVNSIKAIEGTGLAGDRYAIGTGKWSGFPDRTGIEITLIAQEMLDAMQHAQGIGLSAGLHRRNIVTCGIADLQMLVGHQFTAGEALFEGVRPCLPCGYLEALAKQTGVREALEQFGQGGLRARIVRTGTIRVGDSLKTYGSHELA